MDLLLCLAERAGETVSKELLLEVVWKGAFVVEGVIPKTISSLRSALGDEAAEPTFILTVPRRGYRLVAPVRWCDEDDGQVVPAAALEPPARPRRWGRLLGFAGFVTVASIAALQLAASKTTDREPARREVQAIPESVERLLLEARHLWGQRGFDSVRRAAELTERAVQEAPDSAEAHAWLALSKMTRASYLGGRPSACDEAAAEAARAIALAPDDPIALCAVGVMAIQKEFDFARAIAALERAVEVDPAFVPARQFLAEALTLANRNEAALEVIDRALALEPLSALLHGVRGNILVRADRPLAALEAYEKVLVLEPQFTWVYRNRARPLAQLGKEREALESLYTEARLTGERPEFLSTLRTAIESEGFPGYYRWKLGRIEAMLAQGFLLRPFQHAEALAGAGRVDEALAELARAPICPDADTFFYGRSSPAFDGLQRDPRFLAIYARFGL